MASGEIAAFEAARDLLKAEGIGETVKVEAITDPSRGLYLLVSGPPEKSLIATQLLQRFPVKVEAAE